MATVITVAVAVLAVVVAMAATTARRPRYTLVWHTDNEQWIGVRETHVEMGGFRATNKRLATLLVTATDAPGAVFDIAVYAYRDRRAHDVTFDFPAARESHDAAA